MGRPGFEPGTNRLKAECSTTELATRHLCVKHTTSNNSTTISQKKLKNQKKVTSTVTDVTKLSPGASLVRYFPVFRELRGALQGSRQ